MPVSLVQQEQVVKNEPTRSSEGASTAPDNSKWRFRLAAVVFFLLYGGCFALLVEKAGA